MHGTFYSIFGLQWVHKPSLGRVNYPSSAVSENAADQLELCGSSRRCSSRLVVESTWSICRTATGWRSMQQAPSEFRHGAAVADHDGPRNASHVPTASHWEAVKDHIYRLYVIENRPLRNVRTILSQDFGFRATYAENTLTFRPLTEFRAGSACTRRDCSPGDSLRTPRPMTFLLWPTFWKKGNDRGSTALNFLSMVAGRPSGT
jgi:hypothetical protein